MNSIRNNANINVNSLRLHHLRQLQLQPPTPTSSSPPIPTTTAETINELGQLIIFIMTLLIFVALLLVSAYCNPRNRRLPPMTIPTEMDHRDYRRHLRRLRQSQEERRQDISNLLVVKHVISGKQMKEKTKSHHQCKTKNKVDPEREEKKQESMTMEHQSNSTTSATDDDDDHDGVVINTSGSSICSRTAISTSNNNHPQTRQNSVSDDDDDGKNRLDEGEAGSIAKRSSSLEYSIDSSTDSSSVGIPMGGDVKTTTVSTNRTYGTLSSSPSPPTRQRAFLRHLKSNIIVLSSFDEIDLVDNCDGIDDGDDEDIESSVANAKRHQQQHKQHIAPDPPATSFSLSINPLSTSSSSLMTCAICLNTYNVGDEICWSINPNCQHAFHHNCIEKWLLYSNQNECPVCRNDYLKKCSLGDEDSNNKNESTTATTTCPVNATSRMPSSSPNINRSQISSEEDYPSVSSLIISAAAWPNL